MGISGLHLGTMGYMHVGRGDLLFGEGVCAVLLYGIGSPM